MSIIYKINPVPLVIVSHLFTNNVNPSFFTNWAIIAGIDNNADAKITGTTPAEFNLNGI